MLSDFSAAADLAVEVIETSGHELLEDYQRIYNDDDGSGGLVHTTATEQNNEILWSIQYDSDMLLNDDVQLVTLVGKAGTGKTLLASRLPGLLPALEHHEALETAAVASLGRGGFAPACWRQRPFRAPHHSASAAALVGGGSDPRPGEISLAHHGVLFLDELPEFRRDALEVLREPMETGNITLSRAARQAEFPARFQLVAAMNPCPCGYCGDPDGDCRCTPEQIQRYRARISGPLLDRIDLQVQMPRIPWEQLHSAAAEDSATVRQRVVAARRHQEARGFLNARLPLNRLESVCALAAPQQLLLHKAATRFRLSPRSIHRIMRMARTIADLDQAL